MSSLTTLGTLGLFPTYRVFDEFDALFETLSGDTRISSRYLVKSPKVNVEETSEGYDIHMAAPGLSRSDFKIHTDDGYLTVSAENKESSTTKGKYLSQEFSYSTFSRSWKLPAGVNTDAISARYDAGILTVSIPRSSKKSQRNEIKVE